MATFSLWSSEALIVHTDGAVLQPAEATTLLSLHELTTRCELQAQSLIADGEAAFHAEAQRGFAHGVAQGTADCTKRLLALERERAQWLSERQVQVVELVELVLARIAPTLAAGQLVRALAHQAILDARQVQRLLIKVHPACVEDVAADLVDLRRTCTWLETLEVLGDDNLAPDDCLLESPNGSIHAHWSTQLAAVRAVLGELTAPSNTS